MKNYKRILVTGGAGFIGSHIVDAYIKLNHQVLVVDNLSTGKEKNINKKAEFYNADITKHDAIKNIIEKFKPHVINHHAAHILVSNSVKNPEFDARVNIFGLLNVMESARQNGIEKIIMASTGGAIYGDKPTPFDESMREEPLSPYGISKKAGELYLYYYYKQYGIPYIVLRYANVYGPRQNPHGESGVIAVFTNMVQNGVQPTINGDGTHTRDYVYVTDVVRANILALQKKYCGCLNIGTNTQLSTNEIFKKITNAFGKKIPCKYGPERPGEQVTSLLNYQQALDILGWEPKVTIDEGLQYIVESYKKNEI